MSSTAGRIAEIVERYPHLSDGQKACLHRQLLHIYKGYNNESVFDRLIDAVLSAPHSTEPLDELVEWGLAPPEPVPPREFLLSPRFLALEGQVYPEVELEFVKLNSGQYTEAVLTGAIGTAKTTIALWTTAYQLYLLSLLKSPQQTFGLERTSEILFIFQSITATLSKAVDYERFKHLLLSSEYFTTIFPFDRGVESELRFPNRIIVKPVSGNETAALGQNVFGGILDEVNFMAVVEGSKRSTDGGTYDQAISLYNSISRRRKSRFMQQGKVPGIFCIVSSKRYPGQFTDQKIEEAKTDPTIFVYDKRTWEVLPKDRFSGEMFNVFIGDMSRKPRIISAADSVRAVDKHLVLEVPIEYKSEFENDMGNALRDIGGVSTLSHFPFMMNVEAVAASLGKVESVFANGVVDFVKTKVRILPKNIRANGAPRHVHIDLGLTGDSAGVVIGHVTSFAEVSRGDVVEVLPEIVIDGVLEVQPPIGGEIEFHKIRSVLYALRDLGLDIRWVTLDSYQSADTLQILRLKGMYAWKQSIDTTRVPYDLTKSAIYDGRLYIPEHEKLQAELISLEDVPKSGKIDHPVNGSKDCADALAGVVYGLTMRRDIWITHGVSLRDIPASISDMAEKDRSKPVLLAPGEDDRPVVTM